MSATRVTFRAFHVTGSSEKGGSVVLRESGVEFTSDNVIGARDSVQLLWREIDDVDVDGADALQRRSTVTRMLAFSLFAFALQKKTGDAYVYISAGNHDVLLRVPQKSAPEVRAFFAPYKRKWGARERIKETEAAMPARESGSIRCPQCARFTSPQLNCELCGASLRSALTADQLAALQPPHELAVAQTKLCPFCAEEIRAAAVKCKHCGEMLNG